MKIFQNLTFADKNEQLKKLKEVEVQIEWLISEQELPFNEHFDCWHFLLNSLKSLIFILSIASSSDYIFDLADDILNHCNLTTLNVTLTKKLWIVFIG